MNTLLYFRIYVSKCNVPIKTVHMKDSLIDNTV